MTYEYACENESCHHIWEAEQKISEPPLEECPKCHQQTAKRLVSGGTGFTLVGSGWFKTGGY